jgi:hypothetical protein
VLQKLLCADTYQSTLNSWRIPPSQEFLRFQVKPQNREHEEIVVRGEDMKVQGRVA